MTKNRFITTLILCFILALTTISSERIYAQGETSSTNNLKIPDPNYIQILTTTDGSTLIGRIIEIGETEIQFETDLGKLTIPILKIIEIKEVPLSLIKEGKYWFPNPNATRLFFASTGRSLKKGNWYFADYYLFFPMFAYGITDNITIAGGASLFPGSGVTQLYYFTPKVGLISRDNFSFSTGVMVVKLLGFDNAETPFVGILYGVGTLGSTDASFTAGLGWGFVDTDIADKPMVMLGGEVRTARNISFVTENWMLPGVDQPLISYGLRLFGEKLSVDLAFISTIGKDMFFPGIPYIDFVYNF
ncbi:MAG: hypothetical protein NWE90_04285 [Candidatus Bathyarchaeota archaeon]|nr:hypothetical protein [Candidatus Bathyarchaeota archaeon]